MDRTDADCPIRAYLKSCDEYTEDVMPKIVAAKKARFLKAINRPELINFDYSENDANSNIEIPGLCVWLSPKKDELFDDSVVIDAFKSYAKPEFSLNTYMHCVKAFLLDYTGSASIFAHEMAKVYVYILAHARDFDDPTKDLFEFQNGTNNYLEAPQLKNVSDDKVVNSSRYVIALCETMDELRVTYNEEKYKKLNINVTYLLLVAARGLVKGHSQLKSAFEKNAIQNTYKELCPMTFDEKLPTISEKCYIYTLKNIHHLHVSFLRLLILYAFKTKGSLTRRILIVTCMQYFKHTGLQMYTAFNEVVKLYGINESELWDHFLEEGKKLTDSSWISESLAKLADFYHYQHEGKENGKSYDLFPYCRVLKNSFHMNLSAKQNLDFTYALVLMVDLKLGLENSCLRKAAWVKQEKNVFSDNRAESLARLVKMAIEKK